MQYIVLALFLSISHLCLSSSDTLGVLSNKKVVIHNIPASLNCVNDYSIITPGIPIIPCDSGVFAAGWNAWYLKAKNGIYNSVSALNQDTSLYYIKTQDTNQQLYFQKKGSVSKMIASLGLGIYFVLGSDNSNAFIYGISPRYNLLMQYNKGSVDTLIKTHGRISQIDLLNPHAAIVALDSLVLIVKKGNKPITVIKAPIMLDGVAVSNDGAIYISTKNGIFEVNKDKKLQPITNKLLHGRLKLYKKSLYVLSKERHQIIEIHL